jgi:putative membrane protein
VITFDPFAVGLVLTLTALYVRAVVVLRGRGYEVPVGQQVSWHAGVALSAIGLLGPPDAYADDLLSAHMAQHLLIADLAAPLLLVGMRTPVVVFLLPREILVPLARSRGLRRAFRKLRRPLVAIPVWLATLYGWHFAFAFEGALENGFVHVLQHQSFVLASVLVWWPVIDPKRRRVRGELWKIGYVLGARVGGMFLGMAFLLMRSPAYGDYTGGRELSPLEDQGLAGGMMVTLDVLVILFSLCFFFWRAAQDADRAERRAQIAG